jgi:hypothetical protein
MATDTNVPPVQPLPFLVRTLLLIVVLALLVLQITRMVFASRFVTPAAPTQVPGEQEGTMRTLTEEERKQRRVELWALNSEMHADLVLGMFIPFLLMFGVAIVGSYSPSFTRGTFLFGALPAVGLLALNLTQTRYLDVTGGPCAPTTAAERDAISGLIARGDGLLGKRFGEFALHAVALVPLVIFLFRTAPKSPAAVAPEKKA